MKKNIVFVILLIFSFVGGYVLKHSPSSHQKEHVHEMESGDSVMETENSEIWTCSMHPHIRQPKPGKCPICGMTLIPVKNDSDERLGPRELKLSENAQKLAAIQVAPVERKIVQNEIRMVGKVDYDETRLATITAWVPGRLDRLYVDYTGVPVKKGDHLVYIYSPDVLTAQEELLQAIQTVKDVEKSDVSIIRETASATVKATREKLRLWGLTGEQIKTIERSGKPTDHITIYAPIGGIVIHKNAVEGMYVQTGTKIYTIADLTQVWVKLDAYESDLSWLRYGQEVEFYTEAYPNETFIGRIAFIDPVLNEKSRTIKVRVNVPNTDGKLKPNMFVRAVVRSNIAKGGKIVDTSLAGKWVSPMHPEIIKDAPGLCDICGMPLVKAESLGFVTDEEIKTEAPLVIPVSAPLITGTRAVVYVQSPSDSSRFEGRVIKLGTRAGNYYIVDDGLQAGEMVVVNGNFKIDSALQIQAKPSMMNPEGGVSSTGHHHHGGQHAPTPQARKDSEKFSELFTLQFDAVLSSYFLIQKKLSEDNFSESKRASKTFLDALQLVDMSLLTGDAHMAWMKTLSELQQSVQMVAEADSIEPARMGFSQLSEALATAVDRFGNGIKQSVSQMRCPMAFNGRGAAWLQNHDQIENPYFGQTMVRCGELVEVLQKGLSETTNQSHEGSHHRE